MRTTWRTDRDPVQVLDLLQEWLSGAEDVTAVERVGATLVVRSRDVPMWAHLLSVVLPPPLPFKSLFMRARTERVLRITATDRVSGRLLELDGDANASVSQVLVATSHELFPEKVAAWDDE